MYPGTSYSIDESGTAIKSIFPSSNLTTYDHSASDIQIAYVEKAGIAVVAEVPCIDIAEVAALITLILEKRAYALLQYLSCWVDLQEGMHVLFVEGCPSSVVVAYLCTMA
jgi:hypothetical protein